MSPHHSDTFDPASGLEHPSWILTADMAAPPHRVVHPRARNLALRRRWRRTRRLRAARRAGWLVFVAAVITLVQSGFGPATTSGASQPAPHTSQPKPSAGLITFYLALPAHASSLVNDALAAAMPNSAHYRHFSSVSTLAAKYGASTEAMQRVTEGVDKFGLSAAVDPSRLFVALGQSGGTPDVATLSYGGCGVADALTASTYVTITNEVLAMLAMSGTSTFIAAGDSGSTTCPGPGLIPTLSFPAVSPVVTAVGGTRLTLTAQNQRASEVVWNDSQYGEAAAGGGGLALDTPRPVYQGGFNSSSERAVPDVSALADIEPGWPVFLDGQLEPVGGTSESSPFVAAATALVDAQQRALHQPRIGLANGWFYQADRRDPASFYDVTQGDNQLKLVTCCSATTGYDQASGLGVPNWQILPGQLPNPAR